MSRGANWEGRRLLEGTAAPGGKGGGRKKAPSPTPRPTWRDGLAGLILGTVTGVSLGELGLQSAPFFRGEHLLAASALVGVLVGISRLRRALWAAAAVATAGLLLVAYTPLVAEPVRECVRRDGLQRVEAVVVLSSNIQADGEPTEAAQIRLLRGYEVLRAGFAKRLVIPRLMPPKASYMPAVRRQMEALGLDYPVDEVGPVGNTRDEAIAAATLARKEGWRRVILVSDPVHLRRAGAAFEKAGLAVLCTPCAERNYDLSSLAVPAERLHAFRDWLWESLGLWWYRRKGWA